MIHIVINIVAIVTLTKPYSFDASILKIIERNSNLTEFARLLESPGLHKAYFNRQLTLFAPTNKAFKVFKGSWNEDLVLNHVANVAVFMKNLKQQRLSSLVPGSPPLWISDNKIGSSMFVNQALILQADFSARSEQNDQQVLHIIDSVLEPLMPISIRESDYFVGLNAEKLLSRSTLYNLGGRSLRIFNKQVRLNQRSRMFAVSGGHTFFMPIDESFNQDEVSDRRRPNEYSSVGDRTRYDPTLRRQKPSISRDLIDSVVIEAHIIPNQVLFTKNALQSENREHSTVASKSSRGIRVDISFFIGTSDGDGQGYVMVRSNTLVGDSSHSQGIVVARIIKGDIAVQNGVVHIIDKPLMVVATTLYEYILSEGANSQEASGFSSFSNLLRDKGGQFGSALLEARDGTLFLPSNAAFERIERQELDFILGSDYLRAEMFGLHFVRQRILSTDPRIKAEGENTFSAVASFAANRVWFHATDEHKMTVEGRGVNATVTEKDIGTMNGVIHVIDRILGIPYLSLSERMSHDPMMSQMWELLQKTHLESVFHEDRSLSQDMIEKKQFTLLIPTNAAWKKVDANFSVVYENLLAGYSTSPQFVMNVLRRHIYVGRYSLTLEELVEASRISPRQSVRMMSGDRVKFHLQGPFLFSAYKDGFAKWRNIEAKVVRPNLECTNGIIHLINSVFLDNLQDRQTIFSGGFTHHCCNPILLSFVVFGVQYVL